MTKRVITNLQKCCACFACFNVCPKECIELKKNENGAMYPQIDEKKCINCKLCEKVCPVNSPVKKFYPKNVYAAYSKDSSIREKSTSGGVSFEVAKYIIENKGIVYATVMEHLEAKFIRITDLDTLLKIQGSKYIHSHIYDCMKLIKKDLLLKDKVLFIGTPCQVAGLISFLGKKYDNLITMDILCHGTPSQDSLKYGIKLETSKLVDSCSFRDNNKYCLKTYDSDGNLITETPYRASYWLNAFLEGRIFRENCYHCQYSEENRCGDISVGDFWGLGKVKPYNGNIEKGVNVVLINTDKGIYYWQVIKDFFIYQERDLEEAKRENHPLRRAAIKPKSYEKYISLYKENNGKDAILYSDIKKTIYIFFRRIIRKNKPFYNVIIRIPKIGKKFMDYV